MSVPLSLRACARGRLPRLLLSLTAVTLAVVGLATPARAVPRTGPGAYGPVPYASSVSHAPFGAIDVLRTDTRGTIISGWAIDPDSRGVATVDLVLDGHPITSVAAGVSRPELAGSYGGYGTLHGFLAPKLLPSGRHSVCAFARNLGTGHQRGALGCTTVVTAAGPVAAMSYGAMTYRGIRVQGWTADPDTTAPVAMSVTVDNAVTVPATANLTRTDVAHVFPWLGAKHGFDVTVPNIGQGRHTVCINTTNVGPGTSLTGAACRLVVVNYNPAGSMNPVARVPGSTAMRVTGWAVDPDQILSGGAVAPLTVVSTVDGASGPAMIANLARPGYVSPFAWSGNAHIFAVTVPATAAAHTVCLIAKNIGSGINTSLGCKTVPAITPPSAPRNAYAVRGMGAARVVWQAPASLGNSALRGYVVTISQTATSVFVPPTRTNIMLGGLAAVPTTFRVVAVNAAGASAAVGTKAVTPVATPFSPQRTPPLITTSRYIRNINGSSSDTRTTYAMGAADAANNPSGHRYLILLQIGGQTTSGVVLSATSTYVTYAQAATALKAYVDGYHSRQRGNAPATIAIGTNNDIDVRGLTGMLWATQMVNPVYTYARRYPTITIAGANDIEPGFVGSPQASQSWVSGYLAHTPASFVFNGSADGCSWTAVNSRCNNGWNASVLHWLSGGASPTRILGLPQIYNTTMSKQWKYISLTGIGQGRPRVNFAGPLTEWTACYAQRYGCGSLNNNAAWRAMWGDLNSDRRTAVSSLPFGTDLRVN